MLNRTLPILLLWIAQMVVPSPCHAQQAIDVSYYGIAEGLTQGTITHIIQDKRGYLWLGTWDGLVRYDGYSFKTFKGQPGDGNLMPTNRVERVEEDITGNLWCKISREAILFDVRSENFTGVLSLLGLDHLAHHMLLSIKTLSNGAVWLTYEGGEALRVDATNPTKEKSKVFFFNEESTTQDTISHIYLDKQRTEWVLTQRGAFQIGTMKGVEGAKANCITEWNEQVYIGFADGTLGYWNEKSEQLSPLYLSRHLGSITSVTPLNTDVLIVTTHTNGAFFYHRSEKRLTEIPLPKEYPHILSSYVDKTGDIWFEIPSTGTIRYESLHNRSTLLASSGIIPELDRAAPRYEIFEDINGLVWLTVKDRNLWCFNRKEGTMKNIFQMLGKPQPKTIDPLVRGYFSDQQGNLWANTAERGLTKLSWHEKNYTIHSFPDVIGIRCFLKDSRENLWTASKEGKIRLYSPSKQFLGYLTPTGKISPEGATMNTNVYSMYEDKKGRVWLGTRFDGVILLTPQGKMSYTVSHFRPDPTDPYSLSNRSIFSIIGGSDHTIWIGSYGGGLNMVRELPDGTIRFINHNNELSAYPQSGAPRIRCLQEDGADMLLIGTTEGLVTLKKNKDRKIDQWTFQHHRRDANNSNSLSNNDVMSLLKTRNGTLYVGTAGGGFNILTIENRQDQNHRLSFKPFTHENGLISDLVMAMTEDKDGNVWLLSENVLSRYFPKAKTIENYSREYFKDSFNFLETIPVFNPIGEMVIGCDHGFIEIDTDKMFKSKFSPPIGFTALQIHNRNDSVRNVKNIEFINEVTLSTDERNISLHFAALDYSVNRDIRYSYRLTGLEKNWNIVDGIHNTIYTNLPSGEYIFEVSSTNGDGVWVNNLRKLRIVVLPEFKETPLFWAVLTLGIALFIITGVYIFIIIYKLKHQVVIEEHLTQMKLQFFTDISHELRTPLTLISSPLEEILTTEELSHKAMRNLRVMQRNADRLLALINQILDFRKIQNNKMKLVIEELDLGEIIASLMENFSVAAEEKRINFTFTQSEKSVIAWVDKDKFEKIIINLLSNAFKYTANNKTINVDLSDERESIRIKITDEGVGLNKRQIEALFNRFESFLKLNSHTPSTGIGLSLARNLVELHHGKITVESEEGKGSCFTVTLLKGNEHFHNDHYVEMSVGGNNNPLTAYTEEMDVKHGEEAKERITVLVIEDNSELRTFLVDVLSEQYNIVEAADGKAGLDQIYRSMPDIILSDLMMPVMDGLEMVAKIKNDPSICHIPIVLLTAKSSLDDRIKGLESGIDDYVTKPFSAAYLKVRIQNIIERHQKLQALLCHRMEQHLASEMKPTVEPVRLLIEPEMPRIQTMDETFVNKLMEVMEKEMCNVDLVIDDLADALCMSRTVFYKKLKTLTGLSPVDFIRTMRIKRAAQLLVQGQMPSSQVAFMVGFNDPKYFSKCFKKEFGISPSEYRQQSMAEGVPKKIPPEENIS